MVADIEESGASLVAISPQREEFSRQLIKKHGLTFPVLRDRGNVYAEGLGLRHRLPEYLRAIYREFGIDLERFNGDDSWTLPMPGRLVIDPQGIVRAADVSPDYTVRSDPEDTIGVLKKL